MVDDVEGMSDDALDSTIDQALSRVRTIIVPSAWKTPRKIPGIFSRRFPGIVNSTNKRRYIYIYQNGDDDDRRALYTVLEARKRAK